MRSQSDNKTMLQIEKGIHHGYDKNRFFIDGFDNENHVYKVGEQP